MMSPLTGGAVRRRVRARASKVLGVLLAVGAAVGVAVVAVEAGRDFGRNLDAATVAAGGLPAAPPGPSPGRRAELGAAVDLSGPDRVRPRLENPPRAGLLFDLETGEALWSRHPTDVVQIASLTKVMTALLVAERTSARARPKVTRSALRYSGSGVGVLPRERRVPVDALLHGLLLVSGNDAAIALADHVAGSEREFVRLMNRRADELGLRCTHFTSAYGLEAGDRSCAADLAALARLALDQPRIARVVRRRQAAPRFPIAGGRLYLNNTNPLLRLRYPGTVGLKTGYTQRAGHTYVGVVRRGRRTLGLVLLDSNDTGLQAKQIFDRAFKLPRGRRRTSGADARG
jgi:serine-type D-Ala-D-Ala carboxypeptidase (penicillin-binding protein 5/6)